MLKILNDNYKGDIHISFGMTTKSEENEIINYFKKSNSSNRLVVYSCTSAYPVYFSDEESLMKAVESVVKYIGVFREDFLITSKKIKACVES